MAEEKEYKSIVTVEELVEQNCNMIDGVINNLPPESEGGGDRERVSMKELLAEKIAEVADRAESSSEVEKECRSI